mmetsp:Transcript_24836/g.65240  ORF Transcript_24836/g.65240 Transcript_24836/m.65240 type:complete len:281 (+) Transcript_24836:232-1074(+)
MSPRVPATSKSPQQLVFSSVSHKHSQRGPKQHEQRHPCLRFGVHRTWQCRATESPKEDVMQLWMRSHCNFHHVQNLKNDETEVREVGRGNTANIRPQNQIVHEVGRYSQVATDCLDGGAQCLTLTQLVNLQRCIWIQLAFVHISFRIKILHPNSFGFVETESPAGIRLLGLLVVLNGRRLQGCQHIRGRDILNAGLVRRSGKDRPWFAVHFRGGLGSERTVLRAEAALKLLRLQERLSDKLWFHRQLCGQPFELEQRGAMKRPKFLQRSGVEKCRHVVLR